MRLLLLQALSGQLWGKAITYYTVRISGAGSDQVQLLLGHSEIQMIQHNLKGHEAPWERITAGLKLP
jgi:hypothetical protein